MGYRLDAFHNDANRPSLLGSSSRVTINANTGSPDVSITAGKVAGEIGSVFLAFAMMKAEGGANGGPSRKQISRATSLTISEMPGKIAEKVGKFNTKYNTSGISIDSRGNVFPSYEDRKAAIENDIATETALINDKDGKTYDNYQMYANAKHIYDSLNSAKTAIEGFNNQINQSKTNLAQFPNLKAQLTFDDKSKKCTTTNFDSVLNPSDFKQYVTGKKGDISDEDAKATQAYKNAKKNLEDMVNAHNKLVESKENSLKGLKDIEGKEVTEAGLEDAIQAAKGKVDELGNNKIDGSSSKTCSERDSRIETLKKQLNNLGTKADFDKAVNEIVDMNNVLESALTVQQEETDVAEAKAAVKNTRRKDGFLGLGRLFGASKHNKLGETYDKDKHKQAKTNRETQISQRDDAYNKYLESLTKLYDS